MSATVQVVERNGTVPGVESVDPSNVNMGSNDSKELVPATYPITAQADGHAFEKWLRMYVSNMGGSSIIDNFKIWLSSLGGGWKTGEGMSTNLRESTYGGAETYADPIETNSTVATQTMPESEPSGPNLGIGGSLSGQITSSPAYSDYGILQLDVLATTPAGALNQKMITLQYDEM